ncbi:hypothetical protein ig2599ANME_1376 [groundwater metagenome]
MKVGQSPDTLKVAAMVSIGEEMDRCCDDGGRGNICKKPRLKALSQGYRQRLEIFLSGISS